MPRRRDHQLLKRLGSRLKEIRRQAGWTQEALAEAIGVATNTLSRYETGDNALTVSTLAVIATTMKVRLADLLDADLPPIPAQPPPPEAELFNLWRQLGPSEQELATRLVRELAKWTHAALPRLAADDTQ